MFAQFIAGLVDAGRVEEDELRFGIGANAKDLITGGLRLVARDGDFLPEHLIQQSRLPDIGTSYHSDESAAKRLGEGIGPGSVSISGIMTVLAQTGPARPVKWRASQSQRIIAYAAIGRSDFMNRLGEVCVLAQVA